MIPQSLSKADRTEFAKLVICGKIPLLEVSLVVKMKEGYESVQYEPLTRLRAMLNRKPKVASTSFQYRTITRLYPLTLASFERENEGSIKYKFAAWTPDFDCKSLGLDIRLPGIAPFRHDFDVETTIQPFETVHTSYRLEI